ncbi:MAG TPA: DUF805 domain-containing protein [Ilumatobacteraceae bacterium]|nr:DUF805 domain-containing protein [Ilumatobacteraceae bacterium]
MDAPSCPRCGTSAAGGGWWSQPPTPERALALTPLAVADPAAIAVPEVGSATAALRRKLGVAALVVVGIVALLRLQDAGYDGDYISGFDYLAHASPLSRAVLLLGWGSLVAGALLLRKHGKPTPWPIVAVVALVLARHPDLPSWDRQNERSFAGASDREFFLGNLFLLAGLVLSIMALQITAAGDSTPVPNAWVGQASPGQRQVAAPPGWLADPHRRAEHRYWDGAMWTANVSTHGRQSTEPTPPTWAPPPTTTIDVTPSMAHPMAHGAASFATASYGPAIHKPAKAGMGWYIRREFAQYATFSGRAGRAEYWWFFLLNMVISLAVAAIIAASGAVAFAVVGGLWTLATMVPGIAVFVRRLHDTNRSGTHCLLGLIPFVGAIILLVLVSSAGTPGPNRYGPPAP